MKKKFIITGMSCDHCVSKVEQAVQQLEGIEKVKIKRKKERGTISFDESKVSADQIIEAITAVGYTASVE